MTAALQRLLGSVGQLPHLPISANGNPEAEVQAPREHKGPRSSLHSVADVPTQPAGKRGLGQRRFVKLTHNANEDSFDTAK